MRIKLTAGILGLILLIGVLLLISVKNILSPKLIVELQKRALNIANYIADESIVPLLTSDNLNLSLAIHENKVKDTDIEYIFILDNKGKILAHTFGETFPENLEKLNVLKPD